MTSGDLHLVAVPTYSYACRECEHRFDIQQAFSDSSLTACPVCGSALRKLYGSVGVVFKGSGFYRNDSRSTAAATAAADKTSSGSSTESSPAPAKTTKDTSSSGGGSGASTTSSSTGSPSKAAQS